MTCGWNKENATKRNEMDSMSNGIKGKDCELHATDRKTEVVFAKINFYLLCFSTLFLRHDYSTKLQTGVFTQMRHDQ